MGHPEGSEFGLIVYQFKKHQAARDTLQHACLIAAVLNDRSRAHTLDAAPMRENIQTVKPCCCLQPEACRGSFQLP